MFCVKCGKQLPDDAVFCPFCGASVAGGQLVELTKEEKEITPIEQYYNDCFKNKIINVYKSPSTCKWPPLESSMIKEGVVNIFNKTKFEDRNVRYIETWIDATNSYGAYIRGRLRIVIDAEGKPELVLQPAANAVTPVGGLLTALGKKILHGGSDSWEPLAGVHFS